MPRSPRGKIQPSLGPDNPLRGYRLLSRAGPHRPEEEAWHDQNNAAWVFSAPLLGGEVTVQLAVFHGLGNQCAER